MYAATVSLKRSTLSTGSTSAFDVVLSPERVRSVRGENVTTARGIGRPAARAAISIAITNPPPADSPPTTICPTGTSRSSARYAVSASRTAAGNGCSGASR